MVYHKADHNSKGLIVLYRQINVLRYKAKNIASLVAQMVITITEFSTKVEPVKVLYFEILNGTDRERDRL